jgi:hypothetical protein
LGNDVGQTSPLQVDCTPWMQFRPQSWAGTPSSPVRLRMLPWGQPRAVSRCGLASSGMRAIRSPSRSGSERLLSQNGYLSCGGRHARVAT